MKLAILTNLLNKLTMISIGFKNTYNTQIKIDAELWEVPYRLRAIIDYKKVIAFECFPDFDIDKKDIIETFIQNGKYSLFVYSKETRKLLWKKNNVYGIHKVILEPFEENGIFFNKHLEKFKGVDLIRFASSNGDFSYLTNANTGEIYDKMEIR